VRAAVALVLLAALACSPSDSELRTREDVIAALEGVGLRVCTTDESPTALDGAEQIARVDVAVGSCDSDAAGQVVIATHPSEDDQDRLVSAVLAVPRPRFADAVWTLGTTTVALSGVPDDEVVDLVGQAMKDLGAT
jgi:hypothetical protein